MAMNFPNNPTPGQQYLFNGQLWQWDGTTWNMVPGMQPAVPSDTPPQNPVNGQMWWRSSNGQLYIWYDDGDSAQWVQCAGGSIMSSAPAFLARVQTDTNVSNGSYRMAYILVDVNRGGAFSTPFFTAPQDGVYRFDAIMSYFGGTASMGFYGLEFWKNTTKQYEIFNERPATSLFEVIGNITLSLVKGDQMSVNQSLQGAGGTPVAQAGRSFFSGFMVQ